MRNRIGIFIAYLMLSCLLVEDALPYFAQNNQMESQELSMEYGEKDAKKEKEMEDDMKSFKYRVAQPYLSTAFLLIQQRTYLLVSSDRIPDSAVQRVFSPPPERV